MKTLIVLTIWLCNLAMPSLWAADECDQQRLSREEFRERQQKYITKYAELTEKEAKKFFPIYFELQDKKRELNDESLKLMRKEEDRNLTEDQFYEILERVCDNRLEADRLDKLYLNKFKKILSYEKIYKVQCAEMNFHREMLKKMNRGERNNPPPKQK